LGKIEIQQDQGRKMSETVTGLEPWAIEELTDRANRRCFGLVEYEDCKTGSMIPGMYVVYAWSGPNLQNMRLGGGRALFTEITDAIDFCENLDYKEVTEKMEPQKYEQHKRWTVSYIPFVQN
jgi:hypothetical protein